MPTPMENYALRISDALGSRARYEALAEECAELAQACMKMCRAISGENPTPIDIGDAVDMVTDEMLDVISCIVVVSVSGSISAGDTLALIEKMVTLNPKWERWAERLGIGKRGDDGANTD